MYASAAEIRRDTAEMFRPPERISVSDGIQRTLVTATGPYDPELTPYMAGPANALDSRRYRSVVFIGPARTGKTVTLIDGWIARNVRYAPGDMLIVQASQDLARYYSKVRIKRMIENSTEVRNRLSLRRQDDNTFDKVFRNGMVLAFGWPSGAQLSGRDFRYVAVTEYDACADDVDGEGSLYILASKRTETFMSAGKTLVETSIRREYRDPTWQPKVGSLHEAPPAGGATMLYNMGTRCWFYWRCCSCGEFFPLHPDIHRMFDLPPLHQMVETMAGADPAEWAADHCRLRCPCCGMEIPERLKRANNGSGIWVPDGCTIDVSGRICGEPRSTDIASFQLSCIAAAYGSWQKILQKYATAIVEYHRTSDETEIKSTVNLDQGRAYLPIAAVRGRRSPHELQERTEDWPEQHVPSGVRFLTAQIDIQAGSTPRFVVQVMGWGVGLEKWIVDRYALKSSSRDDGNGGVLPLDPASYLEDWDRLIEKVIERRYPLADGSGRTMPIRLTVCDSGGRAGVTKRAYQFWRSLKAKNLSHRFRLVKGSDRPNAKTIDESYPDTRGRKDRKAGAVGDVPVLILNTTALKDAVMADVWRNTPGPGYYHFPRWLPTSFYDELTAETRGDDRWDDHGRRNETFDLCYYGHAAAEYLKADRIDWTRPPAWAADWNWNPDVFADGDEAPPRPVARRPRVVARSKYLGR